MNYFKSKRIRNNFITIIVTCILLNIASCSRYIEPIEEKQEVEISVNMEDNNITDIEYTIVYPTIITSINSNNITDSNIDVYTTITDIVSNTRQAEMEDCNNSANEFVIGDNTIKDDINVEVTLEDKITTTNISSRNTITQTTSTTSNTSTTTSTTMITTLASSYNIEFVKTFSRGTYYPYPAGTKGGSGRTLLDCSIGDGTVKGSIASSYLYSLYGYNHDDRTKVYLEIPSHPEMDGYYYVDDCDAWNPNVIDFYYYTASNCPFQMEGVVSVNCYVVNY